MIRRVLAMLLAVAAFAALGTCRAEAANISSAQSGNWSSGATWVGGVPPVGGDVVTIASTHTVTVDVNAAAAAVTIAANRAGANGLVINSGMTLTLTGALTVTAPTAGTATVNVGAGSLMAASIAIGGAGGARVGQVTVSTGTITTSGSITFSGNTANARFVSTGASTVNVGGDLGGGGTLTTSGADVIDFDGSAAQSIGAYTTYNDIVIGNTGGTVSLAGNTTLGGSLTVDPGATLLIGGVSLTVGRATGISGTIQITGTPRTKRLNDLTINTGGLLLFSAAENITMNGNLEVDGTGTISGTQGTWTFQSPGGGTISGTAPSTTLTSATFTTPYTVSGTWVVSGTLTVNGATLTNNASDLTAGTSLAGGGSLVQGANSTLHLGGAISITTLNATASGNTVDYSGAAQTVRNTTYWSLSLSGSGAKTMPAATLTMSGDFSMSGSASATARGALNVGSFSVLNTSALVAGAFTHTVTGDFTNAGTIATAGSTFTFNGTSDQSLLGPIVTAFNNLVVDKPGGNLVLQGNESVNGTLTLTNGQIVTGANLMTMNAGAAVARTNGWVNGNFSKNFAAGANVARTFEVGDATTYAPVNIVVATVSVAGNFIVSTTGGDHSSIAASDINPSKDVNRYWTLATSGISFTTFSSTFNFAAADLDAGVNTAAFVCRRFGGGVWSGTTAGVRTGTSVQITGQSVVGDFACGNVLSVSVSNNVFAFGTQSTNTWLAPQTSVITNDGTESEDLVASISTFTSGAFAWAISATSNGPDQVRAQWSTSSSSGPWNDVAAYATNFTVATNLAAGGTITFYFRIQSPTTVSTMNPYASTLTVTAQ